jgi:hypothetical protein
MNLGAGMKVFSGSSHLTLGLTLLQRLWQCIMVLELFLVEVEMFTYGLGLSMVEVVLMP